MDPQKLEIKKLDASTADGSVLQFINEYFSKNPMNDLFQIEGDMLVAINKYLADGKTSLLAYYDDELVGCRTGNIYTYAQYLKEFETVFSKFTAFLDLAAAPQLNFWKSLLIGRNFKIKFSQPIETQVRRMWRIING